ncbi:MAG: hypothetical protein ACFFBD_13660 [Candidatus Hodarchaeota archaeon]
MEKDNIDDLSKEQKRFESLLESLDASEERYQAETTKWRTERERIKSMRKPLMSQAEKLREQRDELNQEVSLLKNSRQRAQDKFQNNLGALRNIHHTPDDYSHMTIAELKYRIYELDYQIQTGGISFEEEEKLVAEISKIDQIIEEQKERGVEETEPQDEETLKKGLDLWKKKADIAHTLLEKKVDLAQEKHQELSKLYERIDKLFKQEQAAHEKFVEALKQVEKCKEQKEELIKKRREIGDILWQARQEEREKTKKAQKEKIQSQIQNLLDRKNRGDELTKEEMEFLLRHGEIPW